MLAPALDLAPHLVEVTEAGVALVRGAVTDAGLSALVPELSDLPFAVPPSEAQPVTPDCELCVLSGPLDGLPALRGLRSELVRTVQQDGALADWRPNEVFVRRYAGSSSGMPPHQDGVRFLHLVATLTAIGEARFSVYRDSGAPAQTWDLAPGDLLLLRGATPDGRGRIRPQHAVTGPAGETRCSVAFRHNSEGPGGRAVRGGGMLPARVRP